MNFGRNNAAQSEPGAEPQGLLTTAPRLGGARAFQGAELIGRFAVLCWDTAVGRVAMGYALAPAYSCSQASPTRSPRRPGS
ncbi:hypothetical protein ACIRRH_34975 [Kitasatospora sp. NPDC101235]|uniref:hypothetical protein n=1 Tax=Kitasatospora sp. NPDC101235 TaxID=3364101 RepID=UPI003824B89D